MKLIHYDNNAKKAIGIFIPHLGCPNLCVFCNQNTISSTVCLPTGEEIENSVIAALKSGRRPQEFELAYFGGSFTSIDTGVMSRYLRIAKKLIDTYGLYGLRVSARPDGIDEERLALLKNAGATTIEIGAQSMDDTVLVDSGRGHTSADVRNAAKLIKSSGIKLVLQMMTGLPGDNDKSAVKTAEELAELQPDGVRIYPLLVLKNTKLEHDYQTGKYTPQTVSEAAMLCAKIAEFFYKKEMPIIKLGLHANTDFTGGELVAGPYHEAFRELVDGRIIRDAAEKAIVDYSKTTQLTVRCSPSDVSKAIGHKRENVEYFRKKYEIGYKVTGGELAPGEFEFIV